MSDENGSPSNHLDQDLETEHPQIVSTQRQVLSALHIGLANLTVACTACRRTLREGHPVWVYAYWAADDPEWLPTRCFCQECKDHALEIPTLGTSELLIEARLDVVTQTTDQRQHLCLGAVEVVTFSPPTEGASP